MNKIAKYFATGIILVAILTGCKSKNPVNYRRVGEYQGYSVSVGKDGRSRHLRISRDKKVLSATDIDDDGRFDEIKLFDVPKGDGLEKFVGLEELNAIFDKVSREGREE